MRSLISSMRARSCSIVMSVTPCLGKVPRRLTRALAEVIPSHLRGGLSDRRLCVVLLYAALVSLNRGCVIAALGFVIGGCVSIGLFVQALSERRVKGAPKGGNFLE